MKRHVYLAAMYVTAVMSSVLFLTASVFLPKTVYRESDLVRVGLGLPFRFVVRDQRGYAPPFPWQTRFYSPWENPTRIMWPQLLLNLVLVLGVVSLALHACRSALIQRYKHQLAVSASS